MTIEEYCFKMDEIIIISQIANKIINNSKLEELKRLDLLEKHFKCNIYDLIKILLTTEEIINLANKIIHNEKITLYDLI